MRLLAVLGAAAALGSAQTGFERDVQPVLENSCRMCHNPQAPSGGLNIAGFTSPASLKTARDGWERIVAKVASGEMPPAGVPRPSREQLDAFVRFVEGEFDRADRSRKPDPGRVTARRLNRAEYANTIRDLLGVHFKAGEEFPADDSGYGFDNIGDVLTVSPTLLNMYLIAAERIAARAVAADPLPKPGFSDRKRKVKRRDPGAIELNDILDYDAEYVVRAMITGHRGQQGKPVTLVISVDGKPVKTAQVESAFTLVNRQGGATQRTSEEVRVLLTQGPHVFRAEFINDAETLKTIDEGARMNSGRNIYPESFEIGGPFEPPKGAGAARDFMLCDPATGAACVDRILSGLARRAYRRPVTKEEVAQLARVHQRALAAGYTPGQSLQFAITKMLVSPKFLFRIERDPKPGIAARISDLEMATRLSYFLWSSMPDEDLLRTAETGKLRSPAVLNAQVARMLADPKSDALAENFAGQWLEIRSLDAAKPDPKKFPAWNADLREAMRTETTLFFNHVLRENRPISDFLDANYTFVNEALAKHYGMTGVKGPDFRKVELSDGQRGGVLTHASVLTVSSYPTRTSVVLRGKYILDNVFGAPPAAPPPDTPALDEAAVGTTKSLRQQMEAHRQNALCASCHARMDVLGSGLENYDAIGKWRTTDGRFPVEAGGTFPNGRSFTTPAGMKAVLRESIGDFARCLTEKLLIYATGRGLESYDRMAVREIVRQATAADYKFQTFVTGVIQSAPFQQRRAESPSTTVIKAKQEVASK